MRVILMRPPRWLDCEPPRQRARSEQTAAGWRRRGQLRLRRPMIAKQSAALPRELKAETRAVGIIRTVIIKRKDRFIAPKAVVGSIRRSWSRTSSASATLLSLVIQAVCRTLRMRRVLHKVAERLQPRGNFSEGPRLAGTRRRRALKEPLEVDLQALQVGGHERPTQVRGGTFQFLKARCDGCDVFTPRCGRPRLFGKSAQVGEQCPVASLLDLFLGGADSRLHGG